MKNKLLLTGLTAGIVLALTGCGGGGGGSTTTSTTTTPSTNSSGETLSSLTTGYTVPTEISAVPAASGSGGAYLRSARSFRGYAARAVGDLSTTSDYAQAVPKRYIEEDALEQFDVLEQVLNAVSQTHFADAENVNAGPYKAMVAWEEEQDGRSIKQLQPWVIDSRMIVDDQGRDVNRVLAWIEAPDPYSTTDGKELIKAEFKVYESATIDADGTITDYGQWDMNVNFGDDPDDFFTASSTTESGFNVIKVLDSFKEGPPGNEQTITMKGVLYRSGATGYGQVQFDDEEYCWKNAATGGGDPESCTAPTVTAKYAYNNGYMAVQKDTDPVTYKDRQNVIEMTRRYGLFFQNADSANGIAAGDNLKKHKSFGFPVTYTDSNGFTQYAYYGAWQGRHELWGGGPDGQIAAGTTVTKENFSGSTPVTYTVSPSFSGTLTKRTLVAADLDAIKDIPVETWVNDHYDIFVVGSTLKYCGNGYVDWSGQPPVCRDFNDQTKAFSDFTDFSSLVTSENDRKWVNIGRWDNNTNQNYEYVYLAADPQLQGFIFAGAGFYEAQYGQNGGLQPTTPAAKYTPQDGDNMYIDIGGSVYIQYTGNFSGATGWVQKTVASFNQQNWTVLFDETADTPFSPEQGQEYYINNQGANYIVRRVSALDASGSYEVNSELQSTANPVNYASLLPTGTDHLRTPWRAGVKFTLVTDSSSANFLKLIYKTDDPNTTDVDESATPTVYTSGEWGLQAYNAAGLPLMADGTAVTVDEWGFPVDSLQRPVEFNWEYSEGGWGTQQFLIDGGGSYVVLSDPIQLQPFTATNGAGDQKTLGLQFDGWMHGLPDLHGELSENDWVMTPSIADKVFNLSAGTEVIDTSNVAYYLKPLDISVFPTVVTEGDITTAGGTVPDITDASQADLATVNNFVDHGMGAMPTGTAVKYSEGLPVE